MYKHIIEIKTKLPVTLDFYVNFYNTFIHKTINGYYYENITLVGNNQLYIKITKTDNQQEISTDRSVPILVIVGLSGILAGVLLTIKITNTKIDSNGLKGVNYMLLLLPIFAIGYILFEKRG